MNASCQIEIAEMPEIKQFRILLVEDQEVVRLGLRLSFHGVDNMLVVGEAHDGPTAVTMAEQLQPDIILMDIGLPGFDGIVATRKIKAQQACKIMILTSHGEAQYIYPALEAGVDGYCLKDASRETLLTAINAVAKGETWLDDVVTRKLLTAVRHLDPYATNENLVLTEAEKNLLQMILEGTDPRSAAAEMGMAVDQMHAYTHRVLQKISKKKNSTDTDNSGRRRRITGDHEPSRKCVQCFHKVPLVLERCPHDGAACEIDDMIGTKFADRYDILALIGSGSSASVYKARHLFTQKLVAIKILHLDQIEEMEVIQRFRHEAAAIGRLEHPNIISVLDFGITSDGIPFMIMEYVECVTLAGLIETFGYLEPDDALPIFIQICSALDYAHNAGIIHRDLKPSNILVSGYGTENLSIKIVDFGIAKMNRTLPSEGGFETQAGQIFGTPVYMSPEQCRSEVLDRVSDIYSMGVVMYEALIGHPPIWGRSAVDTMYRHINQEPRNIRLTTVGSQIPVLLQGIVMKALRKDRQKRYQTMSELLSYLSCVPSQEETFEINMQDDDETMLVDLA